MTTPTPTTGQRAPGRVRQIARTLGLFWSTSLSAEAEYRGNFVVAALSSAGNLFGAAFSMWLFYRAGAGFPGWSGAEVLVVLGLFSLWTGVITTVLTPNLSRIVTLHNLSIGAATAKDASGTLAMEATARTYRYLDATEVAEQKKAAAEEQKKRQLESGVASAPATAAPPTAAPTTATPA